MRTRSVVPSRVEPPGAKACIEALAELPGATPEIVPDLRLLLPESSTSAVIRTAAVPRFCTVTKILLRPRLPLCVALGILRWQPFVVRPADCRVGPCQVKLVWAWTAELASDARANMLAMNVRRMVCSLFPV